MLTKPSSKTKSKKLNYKKTLFFIAKCLTISFEKKNRNEIESILKTAKIDWDSVVKVSTNNYVFSALYCNLKRAGFLKYLPSDLIEYMKYLTKLNKKRNIKIIKQAKELNDRLLANNITPIFIKGTANLLSGLYSDIAERMLGDIDFIVSEEDYLKSVKVLRDFGYSEVTKYEYYFPYKKHYRKLQKENNIAAIEIHKELIDKNKYINEFNFSIVEKDKQILNGATVLSYANGLNLSIITNQINDNGFCYKIIPLRNAYDVFLFSKKTNAKEAVYSLNKLSDPLNCFLAGCYEVFNHINSLDYKKTKSAATYLITFNNQLINLKAAKRRHNLIKRYLFFKSKLNILYNSILYKDYRVWLFKRVTEKIGLKKLI